MGHPLNQDVAGTATEARNIAVEAKASAPQSEIARLLDQLSVASNNLFDNSVILTESLRPVLRNEPGSISESKTIDAATDLGGFLAMLIDRVNRNNDVIVDARNRLEL